MSDAIFLGLGWGFSGKAYFPCLGLRGLGRFESGVGGAYPLPGQESLPIPGGLAVEHSPSPVSKSKPARSTLVVRAIFCTGNLPILRNMLSYMN